jgi:sec-independent protein translocase protein TatA
MGIGSWWHWLILLVVVLLLFGGRGKIPNLMKDLGQGINAFKKGLKENKDGEQQPQAENNDKQQSVIDRS